MTLAYDGTDIDVDGELTFTVAAAAISGSSADLTATLAVVAAAPALAATGTLTEANLDRAVVTLTLSGDTFAATVAAAQVRVSGLRGVEVSSLTRDGSTRLSVTLAYDGTDIDVDGELTFTVAAAAISGSSADLTATLAVVAAAPALAATGTLTEANLDRAVVTLTLSGDTFAETVAAAQVRVSGLRGVEVSSLTRDGSTRLSVTLAYDGTDIDVDGELTFTVAAAAISGSSADLTATLAVVAAAPALAATGTLTEANLDRAVVTLTLSGDTFAATVAAAQVRVSGLRGVEVSSLTRDGSTRLSVTLAYDGTDIDVDGELTFTVVAAAISGSSADLTATLAVVAAAPALAATGTLTEANLDRAVVTLTLSGDDVCGDGGRCAGEGERSARGGSFIADPRRQHPVERDPGL